MNAKNDAGQQQREVRENQKVGLPELAKLRKMPTAGGSLTCFVFVDAGHKYFRVRFNQWTIGHANLSQAACA